MSPLAVPRKKVLVVDDDSFLREMYRTKFAIEGFNVEACEDGEQALRRLPKFMPDIVLLDILMPKVDGLTFLKKMKAQKRYRKIPVILLTNLGKKETVDEGFKLGAVDYLIKVHFIPSEVIQKVKKYLA